MNGPIFKDECYRLLGACLADYRHHGCGFLEPVYQECLEIELAYQKLPAVAQPGLELRYRDRLLKQRYTPDFVCFGKIILEIKATEKLADEHRAQILNYLHATRFQLGLLVNFGHCPGLEYERIVNTRPSHSFDNRPAQT